MPITLNGDTGITTPSYGGADAAEYLVPVTAFKNRIINGAMVIDQRNAGASVTVNDAAPYTLDRWQAVDSSDGAFTVQQNAGSVTPPVGFRNYLGATITTADSSLSASQFSSLLYKIEGNNVADLMWGTANAQTITISFWVRSSLTGTFAGSIRNDAGARSYVFNYTISSANTWEQKSITIAGDTSGTWETGISTGLLLTWSLGAGTNFNGTAGSWSAGSFFTSSGAVNVIGTNGATLYITGVQLEVGSTATSFDTRSYGTELQLCQRYTQSIEQNNFGIVLPSASVGTTWAWWPLKTTMRASPALTLQNSGAWSGTTPTIYAQPNAVGFYGGTTNFYLGGGAAGATVGILSAEL